MMLQAVISTLLGGQYGFIKWDGMQYLREMISTLQVDFDE
jgi:hypothetical protein